jgi:hypothetical protein
MMDKKTTEKPMTARQKLLQRTLKLKPSNNALRDECVYIYRALLKMRLHARATRRQAQADAQWASRAMTALSRITKQSGIALLLLVLISTAYADDKRKMHGSAHSEPNWIIKRQTDYQVQGVPTSRMIIGKREIDVYPNGLMFEKGNVVGVKGGSR